MAEPRANPRCSGCHHETQTPEATLPLTADRLLGYLWTATGKNPDIRVCDLFDKDDPLVADVERVLAALEEKP